MKNRKPICFKTNNITLGFGYSIMNEKKRTITKYKSGKQLHRMFMNSFLIVEHVEAGHPSAQSELIEMTMKPKKITLKTPIQIGAEILWRGKLLFDLFSLQQS